MQAALGVEREQNARLRSTLAAMRAEMEVLHQQHHQEQQQAAGSQQAGPAAAAEASGHEQQAAAAAGCLPGQHAGAQGLPGHMQHDADRQQQPQAGTQGGAVEQLQQARAETAMLRDENERLMELSNALRAELGRAGALLAEQQQVQALQQVPGHQPGPLQSPTQQAAAGSDAQLHGRWQPTHQDLQLLTAAQQAATQAQPQVQGRLQPLQAGEHCYAPQQGGWQQAAAVQQRQQLALQLAAMSGIEGVALQPPQLHQAAVGQLAEPQVGSEVSAEGTCMARLPSAAHTGLSEAAATRSPSAALMLGSEAAATSGRTHRDHCHVWHKAFATCLHTCAIALCCFWHHAPVSSHCTLVGQV